MIGNRVLVFVHKVKHNSRKVQDVDDLFNDLSWSFLGVENLKNKITPYCMLFVHFITHKLLLSLPSLYFVRSPYPTYRLLSTLKFISSLLWSGSSTVDLFLDILDFLTRFTYNSSHNIRYVYWHSTLVQKFLTVLDRTSLSPVSLVPSFLNIPYLVRIRNSSVYGFSLPSPFLILYVQTKERV